MTNWRKLTDINKLLGLSLLVRESFTTSDNINYIAGVLSKTQDNEIVMRCSGELIELYLDKYIYHYVVINEILF